MDCSQLVLNVISNETIKSNMNPVLYYTFKLIYSPEFSNRSRYFCDALRKFFENFSQIIDVENVYNNTTPQQRLDNQLIMKLLLNEIDLQNIPQQKEEEEKEDQIAAPVQIVNNEPIKEDKKENDEKLNAKEEPAQDKEEDLNHSNDMDKNIGVNSSDSKDDENPDKGKEQQNKIKEKKVEDKNEEKVSGINIKNIEVNNDFKVNLRNSKIISNVQKLNLDKGKKEELLKDFFNHDWSWYIEKLLEYDPVYILDKKDEYCLLYMLKDYVYGSQDPTTSELMQGYSLFVSSIELIFCLRLILKFPNNELDKKAPDSPVTYKQIKDRVCKFCYLWVREYPKKYENNTFIQLLIKDFINVKQTQHTQIDLIALSLDEPILTSKYISEIKLIREGPFFYDIDEIARQLCIIDHTNFSSIPQKDYIDYIVKKEIPESFNKIYKREKHFKCYILIYLLLIKNLENQKNIVQKFIALAHKCKMLNNYQSEYTIISTFNAISITKKELLWKLIEKKYREIYVSLEHDFLDVDLNEKTFFDKMRSESATFVPHIDLIKNQINNFIIQIKMSGEEQKNKLCRDYRDFYLKIIDYNRNRYSFFLVNPLHDFLSSGFWEICKTKQWGIKSKYDFSLYADHDSDAEKLFDIIVKLYKKKERTI